MTDLYLILHKVRGEPAFDIATTIHVGNEEWWIIPTSGHRAYPISYWELGKPLTDGWPILLQTIEWDDLPDHYSSGVSSEILDTASVIASLGLQPAKINIKRRRL